jgi:hypothetical protein
VHENESIFELQKSATPPQLPFQLHPSAPKHVAMSVIEEHALGVPTHAGTPEPGPV